jgi:hypothetical protein
MNRFLLLLTVIVASSNALQIDGAISGIHDANTAECTPAQIEQFFETCVVGTMEDYGFPPVNRRVQVHHKQQILEVQGSIVADIQSCLVADAATYLCLGDVTTLNYDM